MTRKTYACLFLAAVCGFTTIAKAQTRYVTDDFEIMLRTGPSVQNKIVRSLKSGTRLDVLREDAGNGHSQVQTSRGEIGYVLTRFLSVNQSARNRVRYLEDQESGANFTKPAIDRPVEGYYQ